MRKLAAVASVAAVALVMSTGVGSAAPEPKTFVAVMTAADEVPLCAQADNSARGVAVFHVLDEATGLVSYKVVANNLPGVTVAAHIHQSPPGVPGGIVQPLAFTPTSENGVIAEGTFTNPGLLAQMQADPGAFYVNVHSTVCPSGVIRGQLGDQGPPGTG